MLTIKNLTAGYNDKKIIDGLSLDLQAGEHCLILGKSGSGKTTALYAIAGLLEPMSGTIRLGDKDFSHLHGAEKDMFRGHHIGIVYQTLHMVGALSVLENLLLAQYAAGMPQDSSKAMQLLAELGIADQSAKKPDQLSQGQQQRLAVARAAINAPQLIIGDEPTSALDDEACEAVITLLLGTARAANASLIIATHDARLKPYFTQHITLGALQ